MHSRKERKMAAKKSGKKAAPESDQNAGLTKTQANALRSKIKKLREQVGSAYWDLAMALRRVHQDLLYEQWGFPSFATYVDAEVEFEYRKATYLVRIAEHYGVLPAECQTWAQSLGWSKAKELIPFVTAKNWNGWKKRVDGKSVKEIQEILKADKEESKGDGSDGAADGSKEKFVRKAFSVGEEAAEVVNRAVEHAKEAGKTDSDGRALELICLDYMAGATDISKELDRLMNRLEKSTGLRLIALDSEADIVYGEETVDSLFENEGAADDDTDDVEAEAS